MRSLLLLALLIAAPQKRDQTLLHLIDRETQIANLLTAGKLAYDAGDYAAAAARWDALLKIEGLPADVERAVKPLASEAHAHAGSAQLPKEEGPKELPKPQPVTVNGSVSGGGSVGPGGAVITLRRADGWTPKPSPSNKPLLEKDKRFVPHVLAVPTGSQVDFKNEDEIFHNVFSLSPAAKFDTGLHKGGSSAAVKFDKAGVVELLCNIHSTMLGYLVVVDSPWYAVADGSGAFQIKGVPPGEYEATIWHESASAPQKRKVTVADGSQLSFNVAGDKRRDPFPPDKYGKPRQQQLGY